MVRAEDEALARACVNLAGHAARRLLLLARFKIRHAAPARCAGTRCGPHGWLEDGSVRWLKRLHIFFTNKF